MAKKKQTSPVAEALGIQAANVTIKATLDNVATKLIVIMRHSKTWYMSADGKDRKRKSKNELLDELALADSLLSQIEETTGLTRVQTASLRSQPAFEYPDDEIQKVVSEAVDKITALLLDPDREVKWSGL